MRFIIGGWALLVLAISLAPLPIKRELHTTGRMHAAGHFVVFAITAFLLCWKAVGLQAKLPRLVAAVVFALVSEALEKLVYHPQFEWRDVILDTAGVLAGFIAATFAQRSTGVDEQNAES